MTIEKIYTEVKKTQENMEIHHKESILRHSKYLKNTLSQYYSLMSTKKDFNPSKIKENTEFHTDDIIGYMDYLYEMNQSSFKLIQILKNKLKESN